MSEVTDLITRLRDGTMTLEEVAQRFRERSWPDKPVPRPATAEELFRLAEQDPEPNLEGSVDDFYAARQRGLVTDEEYTVLAQAISEGIRSDDQSTPE
jgi:hypothetical protein